MYIPKRYGESKVDKCPFCKASAMLMSPQGVPVCKDHLDAQLPEMKCVCGEYLDMMKGKFGVFFKCITCGTMNMRKVLEINPIKDVSEKAKEKEMFKKTYTQTAPKKNPREQTIRSDDPRYFD